MGGKVMHFSERRSDRSGRIEKGHHCDKELSYKEVIFVLPQ